MLQLWGCVLAPIHTCLTHNPQHHTHKHIDAKYGDKVVQAAVEEGAHYCDITGERVGVTAAGNGVAANQAAD